jgi:hypothetical protein
VVGRGHRPGALARLDRARPEIVLHLSAELVTAGLLAAGGALLIAGETVGLARLGMLLYTVIASAGYLIAWPGMGPGGHVRGPGCLTVAAGQPSADPPSPSKIV